MSEKSIKLINLILISAAIIFIIVYSDAGAIFQETFSGRLPKLPNNGMFANDMPNYNSNLEEQPYLYEKQLFPAKVPYYDDTMRHYGRPCNNEGGCGVLGACINGKCNIKDKNYPVMG